MAGGLCLSSMRGEQIAGNQARFVAVLGLPKGGFGHGGNRVPGQQAAVDALVSRYVANHEPEKRGKRHRLATSPRVTARSFGDLFAQALADGHASRRDRFRLSAGLSR